MVSVGEPRARTHKNRNKLNSKERKKERNERKEMKKVNNRWKSLLKVDLLRPSGYLAT